MLSRCNFNDIDVLEQLELYPSGILQEVSYLLNWGSKE